MKPNTKELTVSISKDNEATFIHDDTITPVLLQEATGVSIQRASNVEYCNKRRCWYADMSPSGGPTFYDFPTRQAALDFEVEWLKENVL